MDIFPLSQAGIAGPRAQQRKTTKESDKERNDYILCKSRKGPSDYHTVCGETLSDILATAGSVVGDAHLGTMMRPGESLETV